VELSIHRSLCTVSLQVSSYLSGPCTEVICPYCKYHYKHNTSPKWRMLEEWRGQRGGINELCVDYKGEELWRGRRKWTQTRAEFYRSTRHFRKSRMYTTQVGSSKTTHGHKQADFSCKSQLASKFNLSNFPHKIFSTRAVVFTWCDLHETSVRAFLRVDLRSPTCIVYMHVYTMSFF
jgi:hypothetical protein